MKACTPVDNIVDDSVGGIGFVTGERCCVISLFATGTTFNCYLEIINGQPARTSGNPRIVKGMGLPVVLDGFVGQVNRDGPVLLVIQVQHILIGIAHCNRLRIGVIEGVSAYSLLVPRCGNLAADRVLTRCGIEDLPGSLINVIDGYRIGLGCARCVQVEMPRISSGHIIIGTHSHKLEIVAFDD